MPKTVDNLSRMEIGIVENKGPNNMEDQLKIAFKNYSRADLAVAFINTHGIDLIRESILQFLGKTNSHMHPRRNPKPNSAITLNFVNLYNTTCYAYKEEDWNV
jgi:hypothetical protein